MSCARTAHTPLFAGRLSHPFCSPFSFSHSMFRRYRSRRTSHKSGSSGIADSCSITDLLWVYRSRFILERLRDNLPIRVSSSSYATWFDFIR
nr:MAG TPA_asm: hypothetical protein [Caudoviricetes sp.]